jgi:hypothetical protein
MDQETIRFCYVARGSLLETYSFLKLAYQFSYLQEESYKDLSTKVNKLVAGVNGYIAFLKRVKRGDKEPGASLSISESHSTYFVESEISPSIQDFQIPNPLIPNPPIPEK